MTKKWKIFENTDKKDLFGLAAGGLFVLLICLPYLLLGEDAVVTYHDQLDGELITYLLNAKYLFQKVDAYPEIMNGITKNGMVSPAPLYILLYRFFAPYAGFVCSMFLNKLVSFFFLFLLIRKLTGRRMIAFFTGIWFACLPFYPVYGLCIPGQPMLCYALLLLWEAAEEKERGKKKEVFGAILMIVFYGTASSLALCGFAILTGIFAFALLMALCGKRKPAMAVLMGGAMLAVTYVACNLSLFVQILPFFDAHFHTHKSETKIMAAPFGELFLSVFLKGEDYCNAYAFYLLPVVALALIAGVWRIAVVKKGRLAEKMLMFTLAGLLLIAFWRSLYQSKGIVELRNASRGVLHDFNFGRFTWLMPFLWCMAFAFSCDILLAYLQQRFGEKLKGNMLKAATVFLGVLALLPACVGVYSGDLKPNIVKILRGGDYYMLTWRQFFAEDLFEQADGLIGRPKEEYRVVSLGIYPAAAAYNGFYCLDAYSNNYDLNYKHQFRRVIASQLQKSEYMREWFDEWGNRCYMLLAQFGNYFTCEKKWGVYTDEYEFDLDALKDLGGEYIISAIYLQDSENKGLKLLNEDPIQSQDSWYRLWVYEIR